ETSSDKSDEELPVINEEETSELEIDSSEKKETGIEKTNDKEKLADETVEKDEGKPVKNSESDGVQIQLFSTKAVAKVPYERGDRHQDIVEIKKKLNRIGFGGISETTLYGSFTEKRV